MNKIAAATVISLGILFAAGPVPAQKGSSPGKATQTLAKATKQDDIRRLLAITGSAKLSEQMMRQMVDAMKPAMPGVPDSFWDKFLKEAKSEELVELMIPVYDKKFSREEIRKITEFYETPAGKKFVEKTPEIVAESMKIGQEWGRQLAQEIVEQAKKEGY